jgi:UDPglucose 6-dehydrogenase
MSNSDTNPNIVVIGTGYVGLTTGVCLAHIGHRVTCCDIDARKIELLRQGRAPIVEAGLEDLMRDAIASGRLTFELGNESAVRSADIVFFCLPTPQGADGAADLSFVLAAATELGPVLSPNAIVVNKSTVPVGSYRVVADALGRDDVAVVSNPEFLREGTAVHDFLHPDRVVVGSADPAAVDRIAALYESIDTEIITTDAASAEAIKYASNGFLAMKISFINSVAAMCEHVGADIEAVARGIGTDDRIGPKFLRPGPGWGGSCFPKDSRALVSIALDHGYDFSLMRYVIEVNEQQHQRMIHKITAAVGRADGERLDGVKIAALGLTFKAGTDDLRDSPALRVLRKAQQRGASICAYDPTTSGELEAHRAKMLEGIELSETAIEAAKGADVVVLLTEWPEFTALTYTDLAAAMHGDTIVDCRNLLDPSDVRAAGLHYTGIGRPFV